MSYGRIGQVNGAPVEPDETCPTPEMVAAGVAEFSAYDPDYERPRDVVAEIYVAMSRAK